MIKPTVGRIVWYRPGRNDPIAHHVGEPLAAQIVAVDDDRHVNLVIFSICGTAFGKTRVELVQEGDTIPDPYGYAEWMPYQKGQAAKTEALEAKLA